MKDLKFAISGALFALFFAGLGAIGAIHDATSQQADPAPPPPLAAARFWIAYDTPCNAYQALTGNPNDRCMAYIVRWPTFYDGPLPECPEPAPHQPGENGCAACPPCGDKADALPCSAADLDGDGIVGVNDMAKCSTIDAGDEKRTALLQEGCGAIVRAYWMQQCQ